VGLIDKGSCSKQTLSLKNSVLNTEKAWVNWKHDKCPAYEKTASSIVQSKIKARRDSKATSKLLLAKPFLQGKDFN
jgi:hypothetical protein